MTKRKAMVVMLPTNKRAGDHNAQNGNILYFNSRGRLLYTPTRAISEALIHELYFTSDEEIKEGDWFIWKDGLYQASKNANSGSVWSDGFPGTVYSYTQEYCKKVVATTNKELWKMKHLGGTGSGYKNYGVPKIPNDFIEAYVKAYNKGTPITQVLLEYEEIQEAGNLCNIYTWIDDKPCVLKVNNSGQVKIYPVEERKWTDEQLADINGKYIDFLESGDCETFRTMWQFKGEDNQWRTSQQFFKEWFNKHYPIN